MSAEIEVEQVVTAAQTAEASALFDEVWEIPSMVPHEVIVASLHSGGYCSIARIDGHVVGASFAMASNSGTLHSHVTGVAKAHAGAGIGAILKNHQWFWAQSQGYKAIGWTFDPLVRRNAWFNLVKLGARVVSYHENFYGELTDSINAGDRSDRLYVKWEVTPTGGPPSGTSVVVQTGDVVVPTPKDIESLRRENHQAAIDWRTGQRELLQLLLRPGALVRGFTGESEYVISTI
ncbi:MAG: hypothetical protein WC864_04255 [Ilumatobacteraceae bacterium]